MSKRWVAIGTAAGTWPIKRARKAALAIQKLTITTWCSWSGTLRRCATTHRARTEASTLIRSPVAANRVREVPM